MTPIKGGHVSLQVVLDSGKWLKKCGSIAHVRSRELILGVCHHDANWYVDWSKNL